MEKLINKQLIGFLNTNNILSKVQSGFRSSFSCTTAVVKVMNDIYNALETQQLCAAIFIDLAKAFDTVDHSILLSRLCSIGVSNSTLSWFSNYLFNRSQYVKIDQQLSVPLTINKGVPQGSVLASTLFSIYINNISQVICSQKTYIHLYADDTILYVVGLSYDEVLKQA